MEKMLFIQKDFETFTAEWGSVVSKIPYGNGFICPLGWEEELTQRGIEFEVIDYQPPTQEETEENNNSMQSSCILCANSRDGKCNCKIFKNA